MSLYFFKPVVWNDQGYQRPGGGTFSSGYPSEHGFGHEEWNNSDKLEYEEGGQRYRVFHTESFGNQPLSDNDGDIFVLMIASYAGQQYLVAVAGGATSLFENEAERQRLARKLKIGRLWEDLWALESVRRKNGNDKDRLKRYWEREADTWFAIWKCPADLYVGLDQPLRLNPMLLTGRKRLITMYGGYQQTDRTTVLRILDQLQAEGAAVERLRALCGGGEQDIRADIEQINSTTSNETTRAVLTDARIGQGRFRQELNRIWDGACAVTGCTITEILRASHVRPWIASCNKQRLDPHNGLLLVAHIDALFDCGLISFADDGSMLISSRVSREERARLDLGSSLRKPVPAAMKEYLDYHRKYVGRDLRPA